MNRSAILLACLVAGGSIALFALFIASEWHNAAWSTVIFDHFPATVGLPLAAAAAFVIVALFRTVEGPIKVEALGARFEGASGPILMWALCFAVIAASIKALW